MATPTWSAAVTGQPAAAGQVDQFLGTHAISYIYQGTLVDDGTGGTVGAGYTSLNQYVDQRFTLPAGNTSWGYALVYYTITGTAPDVTFTVETDNAGAPSGTVLQTVLVPADFWVAASAASVMAVPVALTGLTALSVYHLVSAPAGTTGNIITFTSRTVAAANMGIVQTSPTRAVWTAQTGCLKEQLYNGVSGGLILTFEDAGAKWTYYVLSRTWSMPAAVYEYTAGAPTQIRSTRTLNLTSGLLTSVT